MKKRGKTCPDMCTRYPTNNPPYDPPPPSSTTMIARIPTNKRKENTSIVIKQPETDLKDGGKTDHLPVGHAHSVPYK